MCSGSEAGSYLRLIESGITQVKAQGTSGTCKESKADENIRARLVTGKRIGNSFRGTSLIRNRMRVSHESEGDGLNGG